MDAQDRSHGVLLGTALGDALGLPFEGLSPARVDRRLRRRALAHSLVLRRGVVSDDTEHSCMVARALVESGGRTPEFRRSLARQLRWWVAALPPGVGLATARGCLRLWLGWDPARSGVDSAGNGPAMRAAIIGLHTRDDQQLHALVEASTLITHRDARALDGALLVARWARCGSTSDDQLLRAVDHVRDQVFANRVRRSLRAGFEGCTLDQFRERLDLPAGASGFVVETLCAVAYCRARHRDDPAAGIEAAIRLGGDTDSIAAIVGALVGAELGARALTSRVPVAWITNLCDRPLSRSHLQRVAASMHQAGALPPALWWPAMVLRNLIVLTIVLGHGFARLLRY